MKNTMTIKPITFTQGMIDKGVAAIGAAESAEALKLTFFKSIKGRVARDQISQAKPAFQSVAYAYFDSKHKLDGALIRAITEGTLKETAKIGSLTIRQHKENIRKMAIRWSKHYGQWLDTGIVAKHGGKGAKKRATGGKTKAQTDAIAKLAAAAKAKEEAALAANPVKRAIEQVSSISRLVLKDTLPSQCSEGLRQDIEIAALMLVELLNKIK
tara:strand:- start:219 stop:857 length:639 start_codon:yes stop_codon:yes gene_type:complete